MESKKTYLIICEGASEYAYVQEMNRYLNERGSRLAFVARDAGGGGFKSLRQLCRSMKTKANGRTFILADRDIYFRNDNDNGSQYEREKDVMPPFLFQAWNFEDFLLLHFPHEVVRAWREACRQSGHFARPFHSEKFGPAYSAFCEAHASELAYQLPYEKGDMPFAVKDRHVRCLLANRKSDFPSSDFIGLLWRLGVRDKRQELLERDFAQVVAADCVPWDVLRGRRVFVTGATGLIGGLFARALVYASEQKGLNVRVVALVRDKAKASALLPPEVELVAGDVLKPMAVDGSVDFILHAACPTASRFFVEHPDETRATIVEGTRHVLELAKAKGARMVYLSSMEVYGACDRETVSEDDLGWLDPNLPRNSYPFGKREAEALCKSAAESGVDVVVARPVQTFGAGISAMENRVFAQFARAAMSGDDIVMKTEGKKAHCYCYTSDCLSGILTVLLKGTRGEVYNVSNEETFCTIREMAGMLVGGDRVRVELDPGNYPPDTRMCIRADKLRGLGWRPKVGLPEMYERLMKWMRTDG